MGDHLQESSTRSQNSLTALRERLAVIDKAQKNITELSTQVVGLQDILANKQARGAFGEVQLRDIVEAILPPSAYAFQETLSNGKRADCLLRLPNPPGPIAIDSKFPLESYQALRNAGDETAATIARRAFAADVRKHVQDIAERYIVPGVTAESALMFLPSEAVYAELHANFREVVEVSYRARVWIVSPTTLMATLNTIRAVLKDVRMREQAGVIQTEVGMLLADIIRLDDRVGKLQKHFDLTSEDVRHIRVSTDKVMKRSERIEEMQLEDGAAEENPLPEPPTQSLPVD
jgi:DNA recombination protein RmuC